MAALLWYCATYIDLTFRAAPARSTLTPAGSEVMRWVAWST